MPSGRTRRRRARIRRLLAIMSFGALVALVFGLRVVRVDSAAIAPVVVQGDYLLVWRRLGRPKPDSVVLARNPLDRTGIVLPWQRTEPRLVPRLVVATGGDSVQWTATDVRIAHRDGSERSLRLTPLAVGLEQPAQSRNLTARQAFLIGLAPGRIDSRVLGPVRRSTIRHRAMVVIWPLDRFRRIGTVDAPVQ